MTSLRALFTLLILGISLSLSAQKVVEKYDNGQKKYQGRTEEGVKTGTHKYWYENGEMKKLERYSPEGKLLRVKEWDENGELVRDEKPEEALEKMRVDQFKVMRWWDTPEGVEIYKLKGDNQPVEKPSFNDYLVHYVIFLEDGTEVESSIRKNTPLPIKLDSGGMIDGFMYGLKHFKAGENGFIKIPNRLAYGGQGTPNIPPYSTLIFQVIVLKAE